MITHKHGVSSYRLAVAGIVIALHAAPLNAEQSKDAAGVESVRQQILKISPGAQFEVNPGPEDGIYEIAFGGQVAYAIARGDLLLIGDLHDTAKQINFGEQARKRKVLSALENVAEDEMIVFGPKNAKRHITVFTDVDCPYCQKLHQEVPVLTAAGLQVRYLAYPRAGVGSKTYNDMVSVWCSEDQQSAMTEAKLGEYSATITCDHPVDEQYALGAAVGITGTPTIIFDDGTSVPGYIPAPQILQQVGLN